MKVSGFRKDGGRKIREKGGVVGGLSGIYCLKVCMYNKL